MSDKITTPINIKDLKFGKQYFLSGTIFTMRDKVHQKILQEKNVPKELKNQIIYYCGPILNSKNQITSAGPTTSARMDKYTKDIIKKIKMVASIGKGERSKKAVKEMKGKSIYLAAIGGAGVLIAKCIKKSEVFMYPELGAEAIYKLQVENLPVIVVVDIRGNNLYNNII